MKNRLSVYSIAILLGLSLATAAVAMHNPFAPTQALAAPHLASGSSPSSPTQHSTSPGPGLLTQTPPALQTHTYGGDDDSPSSQSGTRTDD